MSYNPQVNDYVIWKRDSPARDSPARDSPAQSHYVDEGWVYFKCNDYITIEVGTKDKPDELVNIHKKTHILVVCQSQFWHQLEYVKNRRDELLDNNTIILEDGVYKYATYKSQESPTGCNRYSDP